MSLGGYGLAGRETSTGMYEQMRHPHHPDVLFAVDMMAMTLAHLRLRGTDHQVTQVVHADAASVCAQLAELNRPHITWRHEVDEGHATPSGRTFPLTSEVWAERYSASALDQSKFTLSNDHVLCIERRWENCTAANVAQRVGFAMIDSFHVPRASLANLRVATNSEPLIAPGDELLDCETILFSKQAR